MCMRGCSAWVLFFSVVWFVCFKDGDKIKWKRSHVFPCFIAMYAFCLVHLKLGLKLLLRYCRLFFYVSLSCYNILDLSHWHWEDSRYKRCWSSSSPCSLMIDNVCVLGVLMQLCLANVTSLPPAPAQCQFCHRPSVDNAASFKRGTNWAFWSYKCSVQMVDVGGIVWLVLEFISMGNSYCP